MQSRVAHDCLAGHQLARRLAVRSRRFLCASANVPLVTELGHWEISGQRRLRSLARVRQWFRHGPRKRVHQGRGGAIAMHAFSRVGGNEYAVASLRE